MSVKWTGIHNESGILRKSELKEKKEELFVFGYSCKLFRDDDKALHVDQGKHLIPWMGDESLKIDRYDARGALHELTSLEAPPGGYDWRVEFTRAERDVEQLCDEERYRALHTDEDEEEMYKEEELKRLHAAGYGQVGFNYESGGPAPEPPPQEVDEPFQPTLAFKELLPHNAILPETQKQNAIIEKTAEFIASQGTQMEILVKAKQGDNPQFQFLNKDSPLHAYYTALIALVKAGKWPEKPPEVVEEKQPEHTEEYLHPSLASTIIESAPSIPSIAYRPSADCDYTLLVSRLRGSPPPRDTPPPPGTAPLALPQPHIVRAPVLLANLSTEASKPAKHEHTAQAARAPAPRPPHAPRAPVPPRALPPAASTGLSLMKNYNSGTDSDSDSDGTSSSESGDGKIATPPEEVQVVIDKMAAYVARNGDEFADIVRAKRDARFTFLEPGDVHHAYYRKLMQQKRDANGNQRTKANAVVSFSIKKHKDPDPILPKPALPYESSSDEESENCKQDKPEDEQKAPGSNIPELVTINNMPPVLVYKLEASRANCLPLVKSFEAIPSSKQMMPRLASELNELPKTLDKPLTNSENSVKLVSKTEENIEKIEATPQKAASFQIKSKRRESPDRNEKERDKRRRERKREHRSKSESREAKRSERRSVEREKRERDYDRNKKRRKISKPELDNEIISLVDNSDDLIDLTGEQSDSKGTSAGEGTARAEHSVQRTADLLRRAGLHPAAQLPTSSLASAMVDTLETLRKKKADEEKRRRREKRKHRDRRDQEQGAGRHRKGKHRRRKSSEEERSDQEGIKKKKRKKDKKHGSKDKRKRRKDSEADEEMMPININLTNTLKELRTASPSRELVLGEDSGRRSLLKYDSSDEDTGELEAVSEWKTKRRQRDYSEGEWSSDSLEDPATPDRGTLGRS